MLSWIWLVPVVPFFGFLILSLFGGFLSRRMVAVTGAGSIGVSTVLGGLIAVRLIIEKAGEVPMAFHQVWWTWVGISRLTVQIGFHLDAVSTVMMVVVTFVAFLIHLYSIDYMKEDEGYSRFFAYMNLFVASMLVLVLADNFLLLLLGWEGVGMCSYLLIGFWYREPANGLAAQKAFLMTRLADTAFILGILMIFSHLETLQIQEALRRAVVTWPHGSSAAVTVAALFLIGAIGKSAQIPLQTWLPDAMAGPTPVSALIHAATMVTAGVYLIARMHELFELAPVVQMTVGIIGGLTLLLSAMSALAQQDAKRILAYSTISQIGFMFLALGVGAVSAALFHFMTHAFFKALLFLVVGTVSLRLDHELNIMKMGGLRHDLPLAFWTFLIGAAALAGFPLTAGFFSKDWILWEVWSQESGSVWLSGSIWLWGMGMLGVFLTALYSFRAFFFIFFGEQTTPPNKKPLRGAIAIPLVVLAGFSLMGGWVEWPGTFGNVTLFSGFIETAVPVHRASAHVFIEELLIQALSVGMVLFGIFSAYLLFLRHPGLVEAVVETTPGKELRRAALRGWGFNRLYNWLIVQPFLKTVRVSKHDPVDRLYTRLMVNPYLWMAHINKDDLLNRFYDLLVTVNRACHLAVRRVQNGHLRWYARIMGAGAVVMIGMVIFL